MNPLYVILAVAGLGAVGGFLVWKKRSQGPVEESLFYFKCGGCGRKLKYRAAQGGHRGQCPSCKKALTFPPAPAATK